MDTFKIKKIIILRNKYEYMLGIFFAIITALLSVSFALLLQLFIDGIGKSMEYLWKLIVISGAFLAVYIFCGFLANYFQHRYIRKASINIRGEIMNRTLEKSSREFNRQTQGTYLSILNNDITTLEQNYLQSSIHIIVQTIMCLAGIAVMIYLNWIMTLIVLGATILPLIISSLFGIKLKPCQEIVSEENSKYTGLLKDIFGGNFVIKSFHVENEISDLNTETVNRLERSKEVNRRTFGNMQVLVQSTTFLIVFMIFALGAYLIKIDMFTIGGVMAFLQLLNNVTSPINQIAENMSKKKGCEAIIRRVEEIGSRTKSETAKTEKKEFAKAITVKDVSFAYEDASGVVLEKVSFTFEKGKSYAIIGESGCGKSTFLRLLNGYYDSYRGTINVDDVEMKDMSEDSICSLFGNIQQDTFIFNTTVYNNITLYQEWPEEKVNSVIHTIGLDKVIAEHGNDMSCGELGCNLSGGERQRISIARALLRDKPILFMDEATSALDVENSTNIEKEFLKLNDVTKIVVTHKLNSAILCNYDGILVMKNGRIDEAGTYDELMSKNGTFTYLCKIAE